MDNASIYAALNRHASPAYAALFYVERCACDRLTVCDVLRLGLAVGTVCEEVTMITLRHCYSDSHPRSHSICGSGNDSALTSGAMIDNCGKNLLAIVIML